jgi:hypothetical protein
MIVEPEAGEELFAVLSRNAIRAVHAAFRP